MGRAIYCEQDGKIKPTHPEDAARGLFQRYTRGRAKFAMVCDLCGAHLSKGSPAVAWCQPATMGAWEQEYIDLRGSAVAATASATYGVGHMTLDQILIELEHLKGTGAWRVIADGAGVHYDTLARIAIGHESYRNPTIGTVARIGEAIATFRTRGTQAIPTGSATSCATCG